MRLPTPYVGGLRRRSCAPGQRGTCTDLREYADRPVVQMTGHDEVSQAIDAVIGLSVGTQAAAANPTRVDQASRRRFQR